MTQQMNSATVELNTTAAHTGDLYGDAHEGCQDCDAEEFIMVEINAARGQRKRVQVCDDCSQPFRDAPDGLYDPTALGYTDGSEYDGY
jgi:hypothetical protein